MVMVVDKKVVKHVVETGDGLLEIPVRIAFEYEIESASFVDGSMNREYIFNRAAVLKHFPRIEVEKLDREIEEVVDRSLEEHLRYARHLEGAVRLYPVEDGEPEGECIESDTNEPENESEEDALQIIMPYDPDAPR